MTPATANQPKQSVLARLRARFTQQQETALAGYRELVTALADGRDVSEEDVETILHASGQSIDDLEAAVDLVRRRRGWQADIDAYEQAKRNAAAAKVEMERLADEVEEVKKPYAEKIREQYAIVQGVPQFAQIANRAQQELAATADAELLQREQQLRKRAHELQTRIRRTKESRIDEQTLLARLLKNPGHDETRRQVHESQWQELVDYRQAALDRVEAELSRLEADDQHVRAELSELEARKLAA